MRKAAFIDRDGVINEDRAYVYRPADFKFIPGSIAALRALRDAGYLLVVITNQSGIARGLFSEAQYHELDVHLRELLSRAGIMLDAVEYCPHGPDAGCDCRKPRPGMILTAAARLGIDLSQSVLIGDRRADIEAGRAAGVGRSFLVRSGQAISGSDAALADAVYASLAQLVDDLLRPDRPL